MEENNIQVKSQEEQQEDEKKKKSPLTIILIIFIVLLLAALGFFGYKMLNQEDEPQKTAVITQADEELHDTSDGQIRIKISPSVTVENDTMQNLNFYNINSDRLMQCKIKLKGAEEGDYIYESQYIEPGEVIVGDVIDTSKLKKGSNEAIAELYTYDENKEQIGHVNTTMTIEY